jgi:plasmid stabilization system protein ParE
VARDRSVEVANRLVDDITDRCVLLADHPEAGRLRDEIAAGFAASPFETTSSTTAPGRATS